MRNEEMVEFWSILQGLWQRIHMPSSVSANYVAQWEQEVKALYGLGLGMEEALRYLYHERPTEVQFKDWLLQNQKPANSLELGNEYDDVLDREDLDFWEENGYLVLKNAISEQQCIDTQNAIWDFLGASPENPQSWYKRHEAQRGLMLLFSDHPTLQANRESTRVRKAYEQLYKTTEIYKTIDKVSFNPPETDSFHFMGSALHWDVSLALPIPYALQGLLYLTDVEADGGAFYCVPGFHKEIEPWLKSLPQDVNPREFAPRELKPIPVPAQAGDFIIWHQALPHCATANHGLKPRMVQYLTYLPTNKEVQKEWK